MAGGGTPGTYFEYVAPPTAPLDLGATLIAASAWSHVAVTFDGTNVVFYVGGAAQRVATVDAGFGPRSSPFTVGRSSMYDEDHFPGAIDEVAVYARALSSADVLRHVNVGRGQ